MFKAMSSLPSIRLLLPTRSGLRSPLPWVVLVVSGACALAAWAMLHTEARELGRRAFDQRTQHLVDDLQRRLNDIEQDLRGNATLLAFNGPRASQTWRAANEAMQLTQTYPGLEAVGYAPLHAHKAVNTLVHPEASAHRDARGYDLLSVPRLRAALPPLAEGRLRLRFIHTAPWLRPDPTTHYLWLAVPVGGGSGEGHVEGIEWALLRLDLLMQSLMDQSHANMDIELHSGEARVPGTLLFDSNSQQGVPASAFTRSTPIELDDASLTLTATSTRDFLAEFNSAKANLALAGALTISALLFLIAWYSATLAQRARDAARLMSSAHGRMEARLQGIIATAMDGIITVDEQQRITLFNAAAERIFGYRAQDMIGQPLDRLLPEALRAQHHEHVRRFGETGDSARAMGSDIAVTGVRANGEVFPIDASISRLKEGEHLLFTVILRDITRRRQAEEALTLSQRNLEHSNERLRRLSLHVETTREAERIRIAREIHDDLAATLTGIKMDLSAAGDVLRTDPARAEQRLRASLGLMDAAVMTTRRIINDLRPSILDNLGVWAAIEWLAAETARRAGIRCEAHVDPMLEEVLIEPAVSTALFRIVQEALNNVWRHAGARNAVVRCALNQGALEVQIQDDGCGMDADALRKSGHWGLLGMEERVRSHGGSISMDSVKDQGTSILVRIPLQG